MNGRPHVKQELRDKVLAAIERANYVPRQLAVKKIVAIAASSIDGCFSVYEGALLSKLTRRLVDRGVSVRIQPGKAFDMSGAFDVRCLIATCKFEGIESKVKLCNGAHGIIVNGTLPGFHSIRSDHAQGVALATERLAEMGHRRIALLVDGCKSWGNMERARGYKETVARLGLEEGSALLQSGPQSVTERMAKAMLASPTAVVVGGEDAAIEANYALRLLGRRAPEDVSLVTFESEPISKHMWPPNSTIDQDIGGLAEKAADLAADIVEGKEPEELLEITTENVFIERESTRRLA